MEELFMLMGGLGVFLFGIKLMGDSLKALAGDNMRDYINKYTKNPFMGLLVGCFATVLIQSSSGTTALTISLVRAGLMNLRQAIPVLMGANIGTTITAFLLGLAIKEYALPIMFLGAIIYMFASKQKTIYIGQIIFGFGSLFFGMVLMETPLIALSETPAFADLMANVATTPILGVFIGCALTMLVQSSSATIGILQGLYATGAVTFPIAVSILLGDNIGTTITALLSSIGGGRDARRAAFAHVSFNVFGTILFFTLFYGFGLIEQYEAFIMSLNLNPEMQIAMTHLIFNFTVAAILIWFTEYMARWVTFLVPLKENEKSESVTIYNFDEQLIGESPAMAIQQCQNAFVRMVDVCKSQTELVHEYINTGNPDVRSNIEKHELALNVMDKRLKHYYSQIIPMALSEMDAQKLNCYMYGVSDLERIGDHLENVAELYDAMLATKHKVSASGIAEIDKMLKVSRSAMKDVISIYEKNDATLVGSVYEKEKSLDRMEKKYHQNHLKRVAEGSNAEISISYIDMLLNIERIGDHLKNLAEYYVNEELVLSDEELELDLSTIMEI